ncbi:hypothetical protein [Mucilaginibacter aquaedulcis]|uniref:hypothetical protein n=1 Tax=Mucilaginibacter aquaedulcis TaxID=1187081 RepID=UPI0025B52268|nr:hypothetical protein [Mucilaginibacter aquaedulcis]MDN3548265.1 hypothetical protein [Mucilaginibacter aquaedulcis]
MNKEILILISVLYLMVVGNKSVQAYNENNPSHSVKGQDKLEIKEQRVKEISIDDLHSIFNAEDTYYKISPGIITSRVTINGAKNCTFDFQNGVTFKTADIGISLKGKIKGLVLKNFSTEGCKQYQISVEGWSNVHFSPHDPDTYIDDLQLINIHSDHAADHAYLFNAPGGFDKQGLRGVIRGFVMKNCSFKNSPSGSTVCYLGSGENYLIQANEIDNINSANNNHNGIFWLCGNGSFIGNKVTNSQGQMARFWLYSHSRRQSVTVRDNIDYNIIKYSAFELQANNGLLGCDSFLPADAYVYNNTAISLGTHVTAPIIDAQMLDLYATGGNLTYYNNLGANLYKANGYPITDMINYEGGGNVLKNVKNVYKPKATMIVTDLVKFKSKILGVGADRNKLTR